jgi:hypothetical protein
LRHTHAIESELALNFDEKSDQLSGFDRGAKGRPWPDEDGHFYRLITLSQLVASAFSLSCATAGARKPGRLEAKTWMPAFAGMT